LELLIFLNRACVTDILVHCRDCENWRHVRWYITFNRSTATCCY